MDTTQELSRELADEKRRVAHTSRKLEQTNSTCTELRETLALAQDTVRMEVVDVVIICAAALELRLS